MIDNGPRHAILTGVFLGAGVDGETNGQPAARVRRQAMVADEDGVVFGPLLPGTTAKITVTASVAGFLNAWIDWNGDGTLDDATEQIFGDDAPLVLGVNVLTVNVPAVTDPTTPYTDPTPYSRFRFTTGAGKATTPTGVAASGEVEDYVLMSLGDTIWNDNGGSVGAGAVNNGVQDAGEDGIDGVRVDLYIDANDNNVLDAGDTFVGTTDTDPSGNYLFRGLPADDYIVHVHPDNFNAGQPLAGLGSSTGNGVPAPDPDGTPDDINADDNGDVTAAFGGGVASQAVTLSPGGESITDGDTDPNSNLTVDFGFTEPVSLGNFIWHDANADGFQDGEIGVAGAIVELFASDGTGLTPAKALDGTDVISQTTLASGFYTFTNLPPGDYVVRVTPPAGYELDPIGPTGTIRTTNPSNNDSNGVLVRRLDSDAAR